MHRLAYAPARLVKSLVSGAKPVLPQGARTSCSKLHAVASNAKWMEDSQSGASVSAKMGLGIHINSHFDSGNIEAVDLTDPSNIQLAIHKDPYCETDKREHFQWFNFRMTGVRDQPLILNIVNAGEASYPDAWQGYEACASYDLQHWFRVPTAYDSARGCLTITHTPTRDAVHYAYFAPYTYERHTQLVHKMQVKDNVKLIMIGDTPDGHDLDLIQVGTPDKGKARIWIIARQHPGESMAEWFMEGLLERLTDPADAVAKSLLQKAVFYTIPNMNPDGTWRGHLRTNAAGVNLNRAWAAPSQKDSPEVYHTLRKMDETGVDLLVDVHGDEALPHCFIAGLDGIPGWTRRLESLQSAFCTAFKRATPEFQTVHGYATDKPGQANMTLGSKFVGQRFDCLSLTLEMPFKDCAELPDPITGWSPERSGHFGAAMLNAVHEVLPVLRQ